MKKKNSKGQSRRKFIKTAVAGAAASGLGFTRPAVDPKSIKAAETKNFDIAIVGAGVAGCYLAYRLSSITQADLKTGSPLFNLYAGGKKPTIGLFEYSGRVGGRLNSVTIDGIPEGSLPAAYAEFGGFRFNHQMNIVSDTAKMLGLKDERFYVDDQPDNIVYLRGKRLTREEADKGVNLPYNLPKDELNYLQSGFGLDIKAANQAFAETLGDYTQNPTVDPKTGLTTYDYQGQSIPPVPNGFSYNLAKFHYAYNTGDWKTVRQVSQDYEYAKKVAIVNGRLLSKWSIWALNRHFLSQEAVAFLEDSGGYNSEGTAGTVATNLDETFYFATSTRGTPAIDTEWRHITDGYSAIPGGLYEKYEQKTKTPFFDKHQLIRFDKINAGIPGGKLYKLLFYKRTQGPANTQTAAMAENLKKGIKFVDGVEMPATDQSDNFVEVQARFVALTMPKRSLELLDQNNFFFQSPSVVKLLQSVISVPAIRIFMAYPYPWWKAAYASQTGLKPTSGPVGRCTTDMGVRQWYYWGYDGGPANDKKAPAFLLASYANGMAEQYWKSLQRGQPFDKLPGSTNPRSARMVLAGGPRSATVNMAEEAHRQLVRAHGLQLKDVPKPYYAHFENWTKDPWGGGWHSWDVGKDQDELIPQILQPLKNENIFIAGECYSNVQGWVWGALNTAENILQCRLGLKWPDFLRKEGTWLGPGTKWLLPGESDPCLPEDEQ